MITTNTPKYRFVAFGRGDRLPEEFWDLTPYDKFETLMCNTNHYQCDGYTDLPSVNFDDEVFSLENGLFIFFFNQTRGYAGVFERFAS